MRQSIAYLLENLPRLGEADDLETALQELIECAKVGKERGKAWASDEVYQVIKSAFEEFRDELRGRLELFLEEPEEVGEAVRVGQRFLRVADAAARAYQQRKRSEGVVDFQDLLARTRDLLRDQPEVRAALQRRYRFILIDELQDTDPVQHELVEHLCGDSLTAGKLFAVGDHQQSIYRFRGAAVELFTELRRRVPEPGRQALSINFRSQPAILHFANALFTRHLRHFQALEPHHAQANPGACIEFLWNVESERSSADEQRAREADLIARRLRRLLDDGEPLVREGERRPSCAPPAPAILPCCFAR
jgi:ATP-dependent exoDNAse (exonuclease V) beta subunit